MVKPGDKFGKLTVIQVVGRNNNKNLVWKCQCDCGNTVEVPTSSLTSGNTKSCGCLHKESMKLMGKAARWLNDYDLTGEYGIGKATNGEEFYFDKEDYDLIKEYTWSINDQGYVISNPLGKHIRMHLIVMGRDGNNDGKDVDHINHNRKDNRKENLRIIEHYQNITNCKTYSNNTSGRKGVYWDKSRNKWMALLTYNQKTYHLGRFDNYEDAVLAREKAEKEIHGEYHFKE